MKYSANCKYYRCDYNSKLNNFNVLCAIKGLNIKNS